VDADEAPRLRLNAQLDQFSAGVREALAATRAQLDALAGRVAALERASRAQAEEVVRLKEARGEYFPDEAPNI
jgi:hypothetical protein